MSTLIDDCQCPNPEGRKRTDKPCRRCGEQRKGKHRTYCNRCWALKISVWRQNNPEREKEISRKSSMAYRKGRPYREWLRARRATRAVLGST